MATKSAKKCKSFFKITVGKLIIALIFMILLTWSIIDINSIESTPGMVFSKVLGWPSAIFFDLRNIPSTSSGNGKAVLSLILAVEAFYFYLMACIISFYIMYQIKPRGKNEMQPIQ